MRERNELTPCNNNIIMLSILCKHYNADIQSNVMNLRDRDNLRRKDKKPVPKVSFVRRFDCIHKQLDVMF